MLCYGAPPHMLDDFTLVKEAWGPGPVPGTMSHTPPSAGIACTCKQGFSAPTLGQCNVMFTEHCRGGNQQTWRLDCS